ncbi:MAG: hypothetical protein R3E58_11510 [Phycisphaerae bacterium]
MSITIAIRDETTSGDIRDAGTLEFESGAHDRAGVDSQPRVSEVKDHNTKRNQTHFGGLVQPTDTEEELNGFTASSNRGGWLEAAVRRHSSKAFDENLNSATRQRSAGEAADEGNRSCRDSRIVSSVEEFR